MMKQFKWFALGVIAVTCFWMSMAIWQVISGETALYQAFVDIVVVIAGIATIIALAIAYRTYKNWTIPIKLARVEKVLDLLLQRQKLIVSISEQFSRCENVGSFEHSYNHITSLDNIYAMHIATHLSILGLLDESDSIKSSVLPIEDNSPQNPEHFSTAVSAALASTFEITRVVKDMLTEINHRSL
ncbi:hypothetical protein L9G74_00085 [Shewanella sp. C32]|uniref:DUF3087 domain-containing protein n=1 Tax=Shewanella electrica TaxID=515560 RepID=A0ABT2FF22_9GAMM|nr:hypothetical protein [Shewanella electrica]MCH1925008.1 hypothetical protein [Shewanella electrica]MCS4554832.1 hypothetical protein [Shewanella electrica]